MKKTVIFLLVATILIGVIYAVWIYNQAPDDISKMKAEQSIDAKDLIAEFEKDAAAAHLNYTGKVIAIKGSVNSMENPVSITFNAGEKYMISFQFNDSLKTTYTSGTELSIKGQYNGYLEPDDMFGMPGNIQISQSSIEQ